MKRQHRSMLEIILRYKTHLNIGAFLAVGLWAAWIAWMTRPGDIDMPASGNGPICRMGQIR